MDEDELGALGPDEMDMDLDDGKEIELADEPTSPKKGAKKKGKRRGDHGDKSFSQRASRR